MSCPRCAAGVVAALDPVEADVADYVSLTAQLDQLAAEGRVVEFAELRESQVGPLSGQILDGLDALATAARSTPRPAPRMPSGPPSAPGRLSWWRSPSAPDWCSCSAPSRSHACADRRVRWATMGATRRFPRRPVPRKRACAHSSPHPRAGSWTARSASRSASPSAHWPSSRLASPASPPTASPSSGTPSRSSTPRPSCPSTELSRSSAASRATVRGSSSTPSPTAPPGRSSAPSSRARG